MPIKQNTPQKGIGVKKHRLSTTISAKHWELLKKHSNHFETQQKALEHAIEKLENSHSGTELSPEAKLWVHMGTDIGSICAVYRETLRTLLENSDIERVLQMSRGEVIYIIEDYFQKPLKKISLKEILDALVFTGITTSWFDLASYEDKGEYYCLKVAHSLSLNGSKLVKLWLDELFKAYGARTESNISVHSIFMKIYKNS
jgi:activator of 2-hydroxyglutaryl-CoA dehydratase